MPKYKPEFQKQLTDFRRTQILDAATIVFAERGFRKATIRMVAQTAGVADGTIYNYFKNKEELLLAILDRLNETEQREADFATGGEGADLRAFMAGYIRQRIFLIWPNADVFQAVLPELLSDADLRQRYYAETIAPTLAIAESGFEAMIAAGMMRPIDVPLAVRGMAGLVFGLLVMTIWGDRELNERWQELPDVLATMLCDGVVPREPNKKKHD